MFVSYLKHVVFRGLEFDEEKISHALSLPLREQLLSLRELVPARSQENTRSRKRAETLMRFLPKPFRPKVYLDFGGADGSITAELASLLRAREAICADLTEWQNMHHSSTRDQRVHFLPLDSLDIPLEDSSIDFCTVLQVLHHVPDPSRSIRELWRVLKPGGYLLLREHDCVNEEVARRLDWVHYLYEIVLVPVPNWGYLEHNAQYHSISEWLQMLEGFRVVRIQKARDDDIHRNFHILLQKGN